LAELLAAAAGKRCIELPQLITRAALHLECRVVEFPYARMLAEADAPEWSVRHPILLVQREFHHPLV
jgi:hypothetical protein